MHSTTNIETMVKQANILGRLYRGATGALKAAPKGALMGGLAAGALAAPTMGLAPALGVGGAGLFAGGLFGGAARGAIGGVRGLLSRSPRALAPAARTAEEFANVLQKGNFLARPAGAAAVGGGLGYLLSDEDNKLMGMALGAGGGLLARPGVLKMLARRAGTV